MATTQQNKKSSNGANTARKTTARGPARKPARRAPDPSIPSWTAAVASIVGAGVAVGVGLYATRRQWMPKAEQWGDNLNGRFHDLRDRYATSASNDLEDEYWEEQDELAVQTLAEDDANKVPSYPDVKSVG